MTRNRLRALLLGSFLSCWTLAASAQEEIIEHEGSKYIIHVERLNPDAEMTLLDVLHICPELMSSDGKTLTANFILSVDDIFLSADYEPLLEGIKACDLSEVIVSGYGAVLNATDGTSGTIDLQFKEAEGLAGKLALKGSTYGNGQLYADVVSRSEKVTVRAFAQTKLQYGTADASGNSITSRNAVENAMLFVDWQATDDDLLKLKLSQGYGDRKNRMLDADLYEETDMIRERWGELVATYERNLNEQEAGLYFEAGMNYTGTDLDLLKSRTAQPWWIAEFSVPFLKQSLWMTAGYEGGYMNLWDKSISREQNLYNDLYVQLDHKKGPWVISVGDRFRHNNFWDRNYVKGDRSLWSYNRNDHALHASVGYQKGRHFAQGTFSRSFFNPLASDFQDYLDDESIHHNTNYKTNLAWRWEGRYTYQTEHLVATGSVTHTLRTDMLIPNEALTGLGSVVTWHHEPLRLTGGANVYHLHISSDEAIDETFFSLKLAPILLLGKGFRLSSVLIYNSRRDYYGTHAHLNASVKMNKDLGKRCNVFADFHDIAGQPSGEWYHLTQSFKNRALTIGFTYYPWR